MIYQRIVKEKKPLNLSKMRKTAKKLYEIIFLLHY